MTVWDDAASADPIGDIRKAVERIREKPYMPDYIAGYEGDKDVVANSDDFGGNPKLRPHEQHWGMTYTGNNVNSASGTITTEHIVGPAVDLSKAIPVDDEGTRASVVDAARFLLENATGLDVESPHGRDTPRRFVKMLYELTTPQPFEFTVFPAEGYDQLITVRDIPFVSLCNHHIVPFIGRAHVGYIPQEKMAGLSKLARTVKFFAAGLQTQENLTSQIADHVQANLDPLGVAVVVDAEHMCMTIRGVQTPGALTRTSAMLGVFGDHDRTAKAEFMEGIQ